MGKDIDDQIEEYISALEPVETDQDNHSKKNYLIDSDKFWTAVFIGVMVNIILGFIFPLTFSLFGGIISGYYLSGGIGKSIKAGFFCGLFSGIISVMVFFLSAGLAFAFIMLIVHQITGISSILVVSLICLALGIIYSLVGMFGGAIGGIIASLMK
jgi:hypothetical protein